MRLDYKTLLFSFLLILCTFGVASIASAQTFSRADAVTATATSEVLIIAGKRFNGGTGKTGAVYILRTSSKTGKEYKQYLGYYTTKKFEGQTVFRNKDGNEFCIYELGRTGFPKKIVLKVN